MQPSPTAYREEAVTVPIAGGRLAGTLTLPAGPGPFRVALIIAGSGPTDRNGNSALGVTVATYEKLARTLASDDVATLRYDKRGLGESTPAEPEKDLRFDDYVNDALAWTHLLEADARFRGVTIVGHSEGALIGIVATERDPKVAALVTLAGAGRDLATILDEQVRENPANPLGIVAEVVAYDASLRAGKTVSDPDPALAALFRPSVQPYLISEFAYDPAREIAHVRVPVCIFQGTTDLQVDPDDARALAAANPSAKLVLLDGVNHVFVDAPADRAANVATYANAALPIDPRVAPAIADCVR